MFGDFAADVVIGQLAHNVYCAVEFEDARPNSVLHKTEARASKYWGQRLERGFSQLVDWFFVLDDQRGTAAFTRLFGAGHIQFFGMLVIGRSADLDAHDMGRLQWRADRVSINTHKIFCYTYDDLLSDLERNWQAFSRVGRHPVDPRS